MSSCSSPAGVVWTISGFGNGISDTRNQGNSVRYALDNDGVGTDDTSIGSNPSTLTFQNLGCADDNAVVTCLNATVTGAKMSIIQIGESTCHAVHTVGGFHLLLSC